jgi:tetratricopeptide (TPR) repeat protein
MENGELLFGIILLGNTLLAVVYLCWGIFAHKTNERGENERLSYIFRAICILICPVVAAVFLLVGTLMEKFFFRKNVNLLELLFNKERVEQIVKADEEREKNMASMEEALAVSDYGNLRELTMNVIKGDVAKSLSAISKALDSEDSETSHYAASVLSKELNDFRVNVKKIEHQMKEEEEAHPDDLSERDHYGILLLDYMDRILKQHVLTHMEQEYFVREMNDTGEKLYGSDAMTAGAYSGVAQRLMEIGDYDKAGIWCDRAMEKYPWELSSYQCKLKLLYLREDREGFLDMLRRLKKSGITLDNESMEMIRMFE